MITTVNVVKVSGREWSWSQTVKQYQCCLSVWNRKEQSPMLKSSCIKHFLLADILGQIITYWGVNCCWLWLFLSESLSVTHSERVDAFQNRNIKSRSSLYKNLQYLRVAEDVSSVSRKGSARIQGNILYLQICKAQNNNSTKLIRFTYYHKECQSCSGYLCTTFSHSLGNTL